MENVTINTNERLIVKDKVSFIMTENCPFLCEHCFRDDRRPNTISIEVIDTILDQIKINGILHLGGGEPLLKTKILVYFLSQLYKLGNKPKEITLYTNASICPNKFEEFIAIISGTGVALRLLVSNDYYHVQERLRLNNGEDNIVTRLREYQKIMFAYGFKRPVDDYFWMLEKYESCINGEGVAAIGRGRNIPGAKVCNRNFNLHDSVFLKDQNIIGSFQVQTNGRITPFFDMSWREIDEHYDQECNILNKPLKMILKKS